MKKLLFVIIFAGLTCLGRYTFGMNNNDPKNCIYLIDGISIYEYKGDYKKNIKSYIKGIKKFKPFVDLNRCYGPFELKCIIQQLYPTPISWGFKILNLLQESEVLSEEFKETICSFLDEKSRIDKVRIEISNKIFKSSRKVYSGELELSEEKKEEFLNLSNEQTDNLYSVIIENFSIKINNFVNEIKEMKEISPDDLNDEFLLQFEFDKRNNYEDIINEVKSFTNKMKSLSSMKSELKK